MHLHLSIHNTTEHRIMSTLTDMEIGVVHLFIKVVCMVYTRGSTQYILPYLFLAKLIHE